MIHHQGAEALFRQQQDILHTQLQKEVDQLKSEIDRIADSANFNGIKLLDGSMKTGTTVNIAADTISGTVNQQNIKLTAAGEKVDFRGGFKSGDNVTINGVTYTYEKTATGTDGKTFKDFATLKSAARKNGVNIGDNSSAATFTKTGKDLTLQIGDTSEKFNQLQVSINDCHVNALGLTDMKISDQDSAAKALNSIKSAINYVSDVRGTLGATQNRLDHTINNLSVMQENIQDAESTIRDTDVADEMMAYTKNNILIQSAQAMLAQANQVPQGVLQLLQ